VSTERACRIALDATYSLDENLSGVGVYSREILFGLAKAHPSEKFLFYYRPHRVLRSLGEALPPNAGRRVLVGAPRADLFHALNQRVDRRGRRTVSTFHDLFVMTGDYSTPEFRQRFAAQARAAAGRSDMIIAVSRFTASQVEQLLGVEPARIRVVSHGVYLPPASPSTSREKLILCVGAIQRRKNIARVVKAFENLPPEWSLVLAGAQDGYGAAQELHAVEQSPRRAGIRVAGYVPAVELDSLYRRASILAFPSLDEGFGMPVLEAMAHGVAVVTSNRSALPEVAGGAALLVDPEDPDDVAGALARLAADDALREELAIRGLARAREFSWESALEKTWAVYKELL
jgi:O-antigen biosynthesis alpha-1,2-mannosyltransferase